MLFIQRKQLPLFEEIISIKLNVTVQTGNQPWISECLQVLINEGSSLVLYFCSFHGTFISVLHDEAAVAHPVDGDALCLSH